jgi:hypothetical protein
MFEFSLMQKQRLPLHLTDQNTVPEEWLFVCLQASTHEHQETPQRFEKTLSRIRYTPSEYYRIGRYRI